MMDKHENEDTEVKEQNNKEEDKYSKRLMVFFGGILAIIIGLLVYDIDLKNEDNIPVVKTLSSDLIEANSYTTAERYDDSDLWETEVTDDTVKTTVPDVEETEISVVTVHFPLDINAASAEELIQVKGIGEVLAQRIVEYRQINGYYYSLEDLLNVEGIGEKKLSDMEGYVYINSEMLPETLPQTAESVQIETKSETTTVLISKTEIETETVIVTVQTTEEEFVMEIEEFVTDELEAEDDEWDFDEYSDTEEKSETESYYPDFPP